MKDLTDSYIAYFSMEIGLSHEMKTYSGGLGVLAGDTVRSAADLELPFIAVSLLYKKGYFKQVLDENGVQTEEPDEWPYGKFLKDTEETTSVKIENDEVLIKAWRLDVEGIKGNCIPIYWLDTDLPENKERYRNLSHHLYGGDKAYRLDQEIILGIGGLRMIRKLGYHDIHRYHINEGHAVLLLLELMDEMSNQNSDVSDDQEILQKIREKCVFTTHTPVAAGHDKFSRDHMVKALGKRKIFFQKDGFCQNGICNMTTLGIDHSKFVNGVAKKHREVSQKMFPNKRIDSVTNGIHAATWASPPFRRLFDQYFPDWKYENTSLRYAMSVPLHKVWDAHVEAKKNLIELIWEKTGVRFDLEVFTIGFARRVTAYKRVNLIFRNIEQLKAVSGRAGKFQIVFSGKAHPNDKEGKDLICHILQAQKAIAPEIDVAFIPNYDMRIASYLVAGVDLWLNTPIPPMEASGTSGMKAALNGVPSLSVLDGWWIEGCIENITGWSIGRASWFMGKSTDGETSLDEAREAGVLYDKLEHVIVPLFYKDRARFTNVMRQCISLNGPLFNTERMMKEYILKAYF